MFITVYTVSNLSDSIFFNMKFESDGGSDWNLQNLPVDPPLSQLIVAYSHNNVVAIIRLFQLT